MSGKRNEWFWEVPAPAKSCSGYSPSAIGEKSMFLLKVRSKIDLDVDLGSIWRAFGYKFHPRDRFPVKK